MAGTVDDALKAVQEAHREQVRGLQWQVESLQAEVDDLEATIYDLKHPDPTEREQARLWEERRDNLANVIHHLLHHTGVFDLADLKDAALEAGLEL